MGRKKISISKITDERNRQVRRARAEFNLHFYFAKNMGNKNPKRKKWANHSLLTDLVGRLRKTTVLLEKKRAELE
jgi:hypothetical protein